MVAVAMMFVTSFPLGMVLAFFFGAGFGTFTSVREDDICFRLEITFVCVYSTLTVCCFVSPLSPSPLPATGRFSHGGRCIGKQTSW